MKQRAACSTITKTVIGFVEFLLSFTLKMSSGTLVVHVGGSLIIVAQ